MSDTAVVNLTSAERDHRPFGNHQALVDLEVVSDTHVTTTGDTHQAQTPVKKTNQYFQRSTKNRQKVLDQEESGRQRHIRQNTEKKGQCRQRKSNNSEVLKMPAVCLITGPISVCLVLAGFFLVRGTSLTPDWDSRAY